MGTQLQEGLPLDARAAVAHLWKAFAYARDLQLDRWEFALRLPYLVERGISESDLRWLAVNGYVDHADELTTFRDPTRQFRPGANVAFTHETCFVLSAAGAALAENLLDEPPVAARAYPRATIPFAHASGGSFPQWDPQERVLRVGPRIVKRFDKPAFNQEAILLAFEHEGWPRRIDDPLPPAGDPVPKDRLRFTVRRLNACQEQPLIRFFADGTGKGIRWELVEAASPAKLLRAA
jgi:hypothetical protein